MFLVAFGSLSHLCSKFQSSSFQKSIFKAAEEDNLIVNNRIYLDDKHRMNLCVLTEYTDALLLNTEKEENL
jgi:hypothetical protein